MTVRSLLGRLLFLAFLLSFTFVCVGQVTSGSIAVITGADGSFFADPLQPATFTISVELPGFERKIH